jgi:glucosyl-dolichyl phosphate glucuronosyltransferase
VHGKPVYGRALMRLSVIIPTHDRPGALGRCLETLQAQDVDRGAIEVIVVDDGSEADIAEVVASVASAGGIDMRCERQQLGGLNAARNRGAALASGEVVAFLDDDTLVSSGWASALLQAFRAHGCAGVGGKVELSLATTPPRWLASREPYLAHYDLGPEARFLADDDPVPVGANCAVLSAELARIGGFRLGLDRIGAALVYHGDTEFFRRLRAAGGRLRYEPDAAVEHCVPAERLTTTYFVKRYYGQGASDELLRKLEGKDVSWRYRILLARRMAGGLKMLCDDVLHGRGTAGGRFEMRYWAGRMSATRAQLPEE